MVKRRVAAATLWATLLLTLHDPVKAERGTAYQATVAGHHYAIPAGFAPVPAATVPPGSPATDMFSVQFLWPGALPLRADHPSDYTTGLVDVSVQDISATTRVEHLAAIPGQRARFLQLWQDSTADQFPLAPGFDLSRLSLSDTEEARKLGLRSLGPLAPSDPARHLCLFSDGPPATLSVLMMCEASVSCQLWWMGNDAAHEATFDERFLPDWLPLRLAATALLDHLQGR